MVRTFASRLAVAALAGLSSMACGAATSFSRGLSTGIAWASSISGGTFEVLTYNVAGLPALFSPSKPDVNSRQVSPHLNRYQIVLAQEDFSYHEDLVHAALHPFQLGPREFGGGFVGDGLMTLSTYPVVYEQRRTWRKCNGYLFALNDCLGDKGFSAALMILDGGASVHVYNLHADAGTDAEDVDARAAGFAQLADFIAAHSKGAALIVGGDTNLDYDDPRDRAVSREFLRRTRLRDACLDLNCQGSPIDRIFFRSSADVRLRAEEWRMDPAFVDNLGHALSDHPAIAVRFTWSASPKPWRDAPGRALRSAKVSPVAARHTAR